VLWRASSWRPRFAFSMRHFRDLVGFGTSVFVHELVWTLAYQIDRLLLGRFAGAGPVGVYTVAQRLVSIIGEVLVVGLQGIVVPVFARVQHDREALSRGLFRAYRLIAFVAFPAFAGLALVAPELVPIILGAKWLEATPVVQASALPTLLYALGFFLSNVLTAIGRPGLRLLLTTIQTIASAVFILAVIPSGPAAVALAMGAAALLAYIINVIMLQRLIGLDLLAYHRQAWPAAAATALMAGAIWALGQVLEGYPILLVLIAKIAAGGLAYLLGTILLARGQWREILELARSLRGQPGGLPQATAEG
jgi:PST family polysaccharide transporter